MILVTRHVFITPLFNLGSDQHSSPSADWSLCCYYSRPSSGPPLSLRQSKYIERRWKESTGGRLQTSVKSKISRNCNWIHGQWTNDPLVEITIFKELSVSGLHWCSQSVHRDGDSAAVLLSGWHRSEGNAREEISTVWQGTLLAGVLRYWGLRKYPREKLHWIIVPFL
jgi:hypothetical protein